MDFDLNHAVANLLPWDFVLVSGGTRYQTRPIRFGELIAISSAGNDLASLANVRATLRSMFPSDAPDIDAWGADEIQTFMAAVQSYTEGRSKKNESRIAAAVEAASPSTGGRR